MYRNSTRFQRARNFIFENKFSREDFLANSHRLFSPRRLSLGASKHSVPMKKPTLRQNFSLVQGEGCASLARISLIRSKLLHVQSCTNPPSRQLKLTPGVQNSACIQTKSPTYGRTISLVQGEGFEPPKTNVSRFTVCPGWPLRYPCAQQRTGAPRGNRTRIDGLQNRCSTIEL